MFITQTVTRQREIIEVLLRNGWDYMRRVLTGRKADQPQLPTPAVLKNILVDLRSSLCKVRSATLYPSRLT